MYLTFDICKRFPDLSGNVKKIIDGAGLQNTVRRVVFVPQDALLLVIPYFLGYAIPADAEYQNAIQMAAEICTSEQLSRYLWMDFDSTKKMLEEDGCVVTKMNQDDWNTIRETCRQVYEEEAAKNENFNMVYSSMQDYREHADTYRAMLGDYGWGFNYDESEK